jgi:hypothetical protein
MQFVEVSFDLLLLLSRYNLTCILWIHGSILLQNFIIQEIQLGI